MRTPLTWPCLNQLPAKAPLQTPSHWGVGLQQKKFGGGSVTQTSATVDPSSAWPPCLQLERAQRWMRPSLALPGHPRFSVPLWFFLQTCLSLNSPMRLSAPLWEELMVRARGQDIKCICWVCWAYAVVLNMFSLNSCNNGWDGHELFPFYTYRIYVLPYDPPWRVPPCVPLPTTPPNCVLVCMAQINAFWLDTPEN